MTRFVVAGLLVIAAFASLAAPRAGAAWCSVDAQRVEQVGVGFDCRFPNGLPECMGHTPGFDLPVPYVRCDGTEVPPEMGTLCSFHIGSVPDDQASCTTADYTPGVACGARVDGTDPSAASASC
jgi:hypothetical protein